MPCLTTAWFSAVLGICVVTLWWNPCLMCNRVIECEIETDREGGRDRGRERVALSLCVCVS